MFDAIPADWRRVLGDTLDDPAVAALEAFVARQRDEFDVYPAASNVFAALELTPFADVRAVIVGQDPYHGPGQATGLAFSIRPGTKPPPSLRNILGELESDLGRSVVVDGSLEPWARHGVLLVNTVLTVTRGEPRSHAGKGWETVTRAVLAAVAAKREPIVFFLWGVRAQSVRDVVDRPPHIVVASTHPSPLSARRAARDLPAFLGSAPFRRANEALAELDSPRIDWDLSAD